MSWEYTAHKPNFGTGCIYDPENRESFAIDLTPRVTMSQEQLTEHGLKMAAAPDLLDFAKGARDMARRVLNEQGHDDEMSIEEVYEWIRDIILEPAEVGILKATGKE